MIASSSSAASSRHLPVVHLSMAIASRANPHCAWFAMRQIDWSCVCLCAYVRLKEQMPSIISPHYRINRHNNPTRWTHTQHEDEKKQTISLRSIAQQKHNKHIVCVRVHLHRRLIICACMSINNIWCKHKSLACGGFYGRHRCRLPVRHTQQWASSSSCAAAGARFMQMWTRSRAQDRTVTWR